ncbi:MAG: hypothetical protein DMG57_17480 [Acidobacteria bacterium]|nr:MAG: hypothetical protein DMG57_17480 [Acidobacteriota bacterium]
MGGEGFLLMIVVAKRGSRKFELPLAGAIIIASARLMYSVTPFCSRQMIDIIVGLRLWSLP